MHSLPRIRTFLERHESTEEVLEDNGDKNSEKNAHGLSFFFLSTAIHSCDADVDHKSDRAIELGSPRSRAIDSLWENLQPTESTLKSTIYNNNKLFIRATQYGRV